MAPSTTQPTAIMATPQQPLVEAILHLRHLQSAQAVAQDCKDTMKFGCVIIGDEVMLGKGFTMALGPDGTDYCGTDDRRAKWAYMTYSVQVAMQDAIEKGHSTQGATAYCIPRQPNLEDINRLSAGGVKRVVCSQMAGEPLSWQVVKKIGVDRMFAKGIEFIEVPVFL